MMSPVVCPDSSKQHSADQFAARTKKDRSARRISGRLIRRGTHFARTSGRLSIPSIINIDPRNTAKKTARFCRLFSLEKIKFS
jgi:hypothetical protein